VQEQIVIGRLHLPSSMLQQGQSAGAPHRSLPDVWASLILVLHLRLAPVADVRDADSVVVPFHLLASLEMLVLYSVLLLVSDRMS